MGNNRNVTLVAPPTEGVPLYKQGLTLIQPYFGERKRFNFMYDRYWSAYPRRIKEKLHVILVDDCGTPPIHELMQGRPCDFNLSIFRIMDDLQYNTAGALNVGSIEAKTDFILQMDSDCALETDMLERLMQCSPLNDVIYKFRRNRITDNPERKRLTRFLPCANLLHKDVFAAVGGFDEDFTGSRSGGYGFFDNHFDWKVRANGGSISVIDGIIVTEYMEGLVEDKPTGPIGVGVYRTNDQNHINKQLYRLKQRDPSLNNYTILRFDYEKVYSNE